MAFSLLPPAHVPSLFAAGGVFTSHWSGVALVGAVFFAIQIVLCVRFLSRIKAYHDSLKRLIRDLHGGGDGRKDLSRREGAFPWLDWIDEIFPPGTKRPGVYTRDAVLHELDTRIASNSDYLLLQRMGNMAPLLGVVLTVMGFVWLDAPETGDRSFGDILVAVTPLVAGVGTGAVLALFNNVLLHVGGARTEAVRMSARSWFDSAIWSQIGLDSQAATVKAVSAVEQMAESIAASAQLQRTNASQLAESSAVMYAASGEFRGMVDAFRSSLRDLPDTLAGLEAATRASAEALDELIPVGQRAVAGLDVSVSAFRTVVEREFAEAAKMHRGTVEGIRDSVTKIGVGSEELRCGALGLRELLTAHHESVGALRMSVEEKVLPAHDALCGATGELNDRIAGLRAMIESLTHSVGGVAEEFSKVAGSLTPSVHAFRSAIDQQFSAATGEHQKNMKQLTLAVGQMEQATRSLATSAEAVKGVVHDHAEAGKQLAPGQASLRAAIEKITTVGSTLEQTLSGNVVPSQSAMHRAAQSFEGSAGQLAQFVREGLEPVTRKLAALDQTLSRIESTVRSLESMSNLQADVEQFSQALARATSAAESLGELHDHALLDPQGAREAGPGDVDNQRGKLMGWLRGKTRT